MTAAASDPRTGRSSGSAENRQTVTDLDENQRRANRENLRFFVVVNGKFRRIRFLHDARFFFPVEQSYYFHDLAVFLEHIVDHLLNG